MNSKISDIPKIYKNKLKTPIIFALVLLFLISLFALSAIFSLKNKIKETKKQYLVEMTVYRADLVKERIEENFNSLNSFSQIISSEKTLNNSTILNMLIIENNLNKFKRMGIIDLYGNVTTTDHKSFNVKDRDYFKQILEGSERAFSSFLVDKAGGDEISVLAVPIHKQLNSNELKGVLFATVERDEYSNILKLPSLSTGGYNYIVKIPSQIVEYSDEKYNKSKQTLDLPEISKILDKYGAKNNLYVKKRLRNHEKGIFEGEVKNKKFYFSYAPVNFNNWYVINVVPCESFSKQYSQLLYIVLGFSLLLFIVIMFLFISYLFIFIQMFQAEHLLKNINSTISKTFLLNKIKKVIVREVGKTFDVDSCMIKDYDSFNDSFIVNRLSTYFKDNYPFLREPLKYDNNNLDRVVLARGGVEIKNLEEFIVENNLEDDKYTNALKTAGFISGIRLPIIYNGNVLGLLCLSYRSKHVFTAYEKELLKAIIEQIAMAIKQANLYVKNIQKTKQEILLKEILSLSKADLDVNEFFSYVCQKIAEALDVSGVKILNILDLKRNKVESYNYIKNKNKLNVNGLPVVPDYLEYWLNETKDYKIKILTNLNKSDLPEAMKKQYLSYNLESITCVPVKFIHSHIYIFIANHFREKKWTEQNIETLYSLQNYISIFVKEKDLYNEEKFISNVSHELKTPIAIINNYTEMLLENEDNTPLQQKSLGKIKNNIDRMIKLIDDILYISKINSNSDMTNIKFDNLNLNQVIETSIEQCLDKAQSKNIEIQCDLEENVEMKMDESLLQQAFINLINNAIAYSDDNKIINIKMYSDNQNIIIKIKDQGIGISEQDLKNIFKRFYRVEKSRSRQTGGAGLGLAIVDKIVKYHNGQIKIESVLKFGTTFTLFFNK